MGTKLGFEESIRGLEEDQPKRRRKLGEYGPIVSSMIKNEGSKRDRYNFGKYGDKPYVPELQKRRENTNFFAEEIMYDPRSYVPSNRSFVKNLIDDIIRLHKPTSGYIIQLLFDEYQRGVTETDSYTNFYSTYCTSNSNEQSTFKLSNNNLYVIYYNRFGDIYPKRVIKEYSLVAPLLDKSLDTDPSEMYAKQIAIFMHGHTPCNDKWNEEIDDEGAHDWSKPVHQRYLIAARDTIAYINSTKEVN